MRVALAVAVAWALGSVGLAEPSVAAVRRPTNIPAQGLDPALKEFAASRDLNVLYLASVVRDLNTTGAVGEITIDEALTKILSGTGLTYKYLDDNTVTILPLSEAVEATSARSDVKPAQGAIQSDQEAPKSFWQRFRLAQADPTGSAATTTQGAAADEASIPRRVTLEEVVVTAQKREEKLQNVPISISVLSGDVLDGSIQSVAEELNRVPGFAVLDAPLGGTLLTVRGVAATGTNFAGTSTVGYYLDSVPFGFIRNALAPDANAYDLERIEVLRGPQGTLYGVNAQNGVVRVIPRSANLRDFELKSRVAGSSTEDGGNNYRGDLMLNVPLVADKLAARAVVGYEDLSGWIDRPNREDANSAEKLNLRLKVNAQPMDDLSVGLSVWHFESEADGRSIGRDDRTAPFVVDEPMSEDYDAYGVKIAYDFSQFSLSSMTSYLDYENASVIDFSNGPGTNMNTSLFASEILSQEFNLSSTLGGRWKWTAGAIYRDVDDRFYQKNNGHINPGGNRYNDYSESFAVFGELTRLFADGRFELTGGLRYFEDEAENQQLSNPNSTTAPLVSSSGKFDALSPRVVLMWHPSEQLSTYASYAEGFRSGFPQSPTITAADPNFPPVDSDNLINYELGAKGSFWNGRLNFDAAVFYIDWEDIQQSITVPITSGTGTANFAALLNGESASGAGVDFGLAVMPLQGLQLGVNYSWNDLTFDADVFSGGTRIFFKGDRLTNSPEHTATAFADYVFAVGGGYQAHLSGSYNFISERLNRALVSGTRVVTEGDELSTSRLSLSLESPRAWSATLFVDNLNDYNGTPVPQFVPSAVGTSRIRPRTIGLSFEYRL